LPDISAALRRPNHVTCNCRSNLGRRGNLTKSLNGPINRNLAQVNAAGFLMARPKPIFTLKGLVSVSRAMRSTDLKSMTIDQLWDLHERVVAELGRKISTEKAKLEGRLRELNAARPLPVNPAGEAARRPYPKVVPKYQNPNNPAETWAGRGKQPRWMRALLRSGKTLDDLRIERS
jgi:DNA-binding protein H-NS